MPLITQRDILLIEDEGDAAALLTMRLQAEGFQVHVEDTGGAALRYAAEHRPDLVILDLKLPDMSGYDVCLKLRQVWRPAAVPILMLTARGQSIDRWVGFAHGADAYLTKPYEPSELLLVIEQLLMKITEGRR